MMQALERDHRNTDTYGRGIAPTPTPTKDDSAMPVAQLCLQCQPHRLFGDHDDRHLCHMLLNWQVSVSVD